MYHFIMPFLNALRYGQCVTRGSHSFTVLPAARTTSYLPLLPSCPAAKCHHLLAGNDCAYPRRDGQAELTWVAGYIPR